MNTLTLLIAAYRNKNCNNCCFFVAIIANRTNHNLTCTYIKQDCSVCTSLTQLYDARDTYRIYYIKNIYMFRHFTLAIFRSRDEKNLVSIFTRVKWLVYSGEVRGELGTRSSMCCGGWEVWVQGFCYCMLLWVNIVRSMVSSYVCRDYMYMYT